MDILVYEAIMQTRLNTNKKIIQNDFSKVVQNFKNTVLSVGNYWKGSDYDFFIKKMESFLEDLKTFEDTLNSYHDFLQGYLDAMRRLNEDYATKKIVLK